MFIFTRGAGTTYTDGFHYFQRKNDCHGNVYDKAVERPEMAHKYYSYSGAIDFHNKLRQGYLRLEKKWKTQDPFFRIATTLISMHVVDAYCLYKHNINKKYQPMGLMEFVEILATQLLHNNTENVDVTENDPDNFPTSEKKVSDTCKKSMKKNNIAKYYHLTARGVEHNLEKSGIRTNKNGKSYNKTNDCVVCKKKEYSSSNYFCLCDVWSTFVCPSVDQTHSSPTRLF